MDEKQVFVDWFAASQYHEGGGLPIVSDGVVVIYDQFGLPRFERNRATKHRGSFETSILVSCDGSRYSVSGNVGRFSRQDNLFNYGFQGTVACANRILACFGLPAFSASFEDAQGIRRAGAVVSRLDVTANYRAGSEPQARSVIKALRSKSISRMKKGFSGEESVWWANTRRSLTAYIKHLEMLAHGYSEDEYAVSWAKQNGLVRIELRLRKRELSDLMMNRIEDITDEKLITLYREETAFLREIDRSDEPDILASIPVRSRPYASAWLAGQDLRAFCSRATLFRHAKVLKEFGLDVMEPRNIEQFPVRVRVLDLEPVSIPDWYELERFG